MMRGRGPYSNSLGATTGKLMRKTLPCRRGSFRIAAIGRSAPQPRIAIFGLVKLFDRAGGSVPGR